MLRERSGGLHVELIVETTLWGLKGEAKNISHRLLMQEKVAAASACRSSLSAVHVN
jgi:hypothetical protein